MAGKDFLKKYHKKRNFKITAEPFGGSKKKGKKNIFVIQKHDATNLHYDFRIEVDGVLNRGLSRKVLPQIRRKGNLQCLQRIIHLNMQIMKE